MGVVTKTKFSEISKSHYLFSTYNFFRLRKLIDEDLPYLQVRLSEYFEIISGFAFSSKDYSDEGVSVCRIGDISKYNELLIDEMLLLPEEYADDYYKYRIQNNDILIGLTGDGKFFKTCYVENLEVPILLNQRVGIIRVKPNVKNISAKFVSLLFNSDKVQNQIRIVAMGKTQKNVSPFDILNVKIPKLELDKQNELLHLIQPIEIKITQLKNSKLKPLDIINKVFGEEFGFNWEEFEKLSREKVYKIKFSKINDTTDFRTATKFHSIKYDFLKLDVFNKHKFKDFAEFMTLGRQIQPEQFEEETDYYYLMPNAIKTNSLNVDLMKEIKFSFFDNLKHIALKYNDLILAASGEGTIGKSAIYNSDKEAITSQFIMKIELLDKSLVEYFHYYMQSSYFLLTVEKFKKGMGNMTNIFVSQVKDFPVLYDEAKQTEIVEKIKSQIDAQNILDIQIAEKQNQINEIIEKAIKYP